MSPLDFEYSEQEYMNTEKTMHGPHSESIALHHRLKSRFNIFDKNQLSFNPKKRGYQARNQSISLHWERSTSTIQKYKNTAELLIKYVKICVAMTLSTRRNIYNIFRTIRHQFNRNIFFYISTLSLFHQFFFVLLTTLGFVERCLSLLNVEHEQNITFGAAEKKSIRYIGLLFISVLFVPYVPGHNQCICFLFLLGWWNEGLSYSLPFLLAPWLSCLFDTAQQATPTSAFPGNIVQYYIIPFLFFPFCSRIHHIGIVPVCSNSAENTLAVFKVYFQKVSDEEKKSFLSPVMFDNVNI